MEKGQHIRLLVSLPIGSSITTQVVCFATELNFHLSAQAEESSTKDTTDENGNIWNEYEVLQRSGDIQFRGMLAYNTDGSAITDSISFDRLQDSIQDTPVEWKLAIVSGANNRVVGKTICSGQGKIVNAQADGTVNQKATFSGTINIYGAVTVGND